ncbi:ATP-binding cassette, subfamily C, CydD/ATP-binding cassette, subfamily C, CydCD [Actinopolymorpha cephalotaxi]|uniref:ATP-binding cassette, subfamily C, CydD/ATP-binding cassette, subfamily C, CydCD n=1 Tax=Actinopolymorpha cephalotaxi TaxID=504797 RepID=A0A1I3AL19_9ACTN|nr:thiol reductant ABC exporter subunit CydD [Actinopolymorpha cephalotaxi]NYH82212.1 thiol reductant ABC exporter CydD subunit [Actinopolymorpha cephalotaxi]SFH50692.1 ATP-binding cassette, subfamily C, CydD/ATP-binding cassette, subfamily C, CydCD [Actinopolymorpha cephalotaxi]
MSGAGTSVRPLDPRLLRYARSSAVYVGLTAGIGAVAAGLVIAQATVLADVISGVFGGAFGGVQTEYGRALALLGLVIAARAGLAWGQEVAAQRSSAAVKATLRRRISEHVAELGPSWLGTERRAALTTLVTSGLDALDGYFARYLPQLVLATIVPAAVVVCLFTADPLSAAIVALTLPLIPVFMVLVGLATRARTRRRWRALAVLAHHFADVVAGLPTLKLFGRAKAQARALREVSDEHRRESLATLRIAFLSALVLELLATLSVALVAVGIGLRLVEGELDLRTAVLVLVLAPEAYLPLRMVGTHFHASADGLAAAEEAFRVLETPLPHRGAGDVDPGKVTLTVRDLEIRYPDRDAPALAGLTMTVRPGETVAVTGPSGAGKSTLLAGLLGFVLPASGEVLAGAHDLARVDPVAWRAGVAWVPQRPYLLAGTIADNIRIGDPEADRGHVVAALARAGAGDLDPDRPVGERGAGLSAGQVRRVALARALVRVDRRLAAGQGCLLLLDEPTAGLDSGTEEQVRAELTRLRTNGVTTIVVTHRPTLLPLADRVVEVPLRTTPTSRPGRPLTGVPA